MSYGQNIVYENQNHTELLSSFISNLKHVFCTVHILISNKDLHKKNSVNGKEQKPVPYSCICTTAVIIEDSTQALPINVNIMVIDFIFLQMWKKE